MLYLYSEDIYVAKRVMQEKDVVVLKKLPEILVLSEEGKGGIESFNSSLDDIYEYLYKNNLDSLIAGASIGLFYSKEAGRYLACVPIKKKVRGGPFKVKTLPSEKVASLLHTGPVSRINDSFGRVFDFIKQKGLAWHFPVREVYYPQKGGYHIEIQTPVR